VNYLSLFLSLLLTLPATGGFAMSEMDMPMEQDSTTHHAVTGHDCCDEPQDSDQDCEDMVDCGKCGNVMPALVLTQPNESVHPADSIQLDPIEQVRELHSTPPLRPPIA
jgi:hypothetical protein